MSSEPANMRRRAVVLLSGGIDSTVMLARAANTGWDCHPLTADYGQRHFCEIAAARRIADRYAHPTFVVRLPFFTTSCALTGTGTIPKWRSAAERQRDGGIAPTYVHARNTMLLASALAYAESLGAEAIFVGANAADRTGYPDCRPEFFAAFNEVARLGTRAGIEGRTIRVETQLIDLDKAAVIREGLRYGVHFEETHSCYDPDAAARACGGCDACVIRREAFAAAGFVDPTRYAP